MGGDDLSILAMNPDTAHAQRVLEILAIHAVERSVEVEREDAGEVEDGEWARYVWRFVADLE